MTVKWFNEAPMSAETREKLMATKLAKGREPLARLIATLPQVTYNMAMGVLKVAPRGKPGGSDVALYAEGQREAKRILGKA